MIRFCSTGTSSGGISTPRSPRATITASARSTILYRCLIADGFSSLAIRLARSPISSRASIRSSGRCTNDSATIPMPRCRANARSRRSFSVSGETSRRTLGRFTPLWLESAPPTTTRVSAKSEPQATTSRRTLPSSSNRSVPERSAAKISGWGSGARARLPALRTDQAGSCLPLLTGCDRPQTCRGGVWDPAGRRRRRSADRIFAPACR